MMRLFLSTGHVIFLLCACAGAPVLPPPPAPLAPEVLYPPPVTEALGTRFGALEIVRHEETFTLKREGKTIFEDEILIQGNPTVVAKGQLGEEDYLLLSRYSGDGCPETNVLVTLGPRGAYSVRHLGNCNGPKLSVRGGELTLAYAGSKGTEPQRKPERWVYRSGVLSKTK